MLRYAITDGARFGSDPVARRAGLLADARRWALEGLDYVQLREKDLDGGELLALTETFTTIFRERGGKTKLLVNHRADIAAAAGADGVHLTSRYGELTPAQVRRVFAAAGAGTAVVSASCHSVAEVERARDAGVNLILFGPVFEKRVGGVVVVEGLGLEALRNACQMAGRTPILAVGGVDLENIKGVAAGMGGIRLFATKTRAQGMLSLRKGWR